MNRIIKNVVAAVAVGSLTLAQPALAATPRSASPVGKTEALQGAPGYVLPLVAVVVVALLLAATVGHHDGNQNSGTPASP